MTTSSAPGSADLGGYRRAWAAVTTVSAALVGLIMLASLGPAFTLLLLGAMAGLGACYGAALGPLLPNRPRPMLTGSAVVVGATLVVVGIALAPGAWGLLVVVLLLAGSPPVVTRLLAGAGAASRPAAPADPVPATRNGIETFLQAMDDDELRSGWHKTTVALQHARSVEALARVAMVRQCYLDELERRAPEAFDAWVSSHGFDG